MHYLHRDGFLDRRHFLRGMGVSLALPWLQGMRSLGAQERRAAGKPGRAVFVYFPNGVNTLTWQIEQAGAGYELSESLAPLAPLREHLTPISGLHHPSGLGKAHLADRIWLTGASLEGEELKNTVSVDQVLAGHLGEHTRFPSLEISTTKRTLAWSRQGAPLPSERRPRALFERLFTADPAGADAARSALRRRASLLDAILEDARVLRNQLGREDRGTLEEYLASVREVELRTERAERWLDEPPPEVDGATREQLTREIPPARAGELYRTLFDLIVLALRTDRTRVVTYMMGDENLGLALPEIGVRQTRHELSHHNGIPQQMERLTRADRFLVEHLAAFLERLRSIPEEGETLLDRTAVLFGSGMRHGHSHGNANLPTLLAGGRALGFRHGSHVDHNLPHIGSHGLDDTEAHYRICMRPVDAAARLCNLHLEILHRFGVEAGSFGDSC